MSEKQETATEAEAKVQKERQRNAKGGFFLKSAVWLLSRFPLTKNKYQNWTAGRRILIGWLLWLIVLPIIPIVIAIVWYLNDPAGFKKSPLAKVLIGVIVLWFGAFGLIATEPAQLDQNGKYSPVQTQPNGEDTTKVAESEKPAAAASAKSKEKVATQQTSNASGGQFFENCTAAFDAGVFDIKRSDNSYRSELDRDGDGIACEK